MQEETSGKITLWAWIILGALLWLIYGWLFCILDHFRWWAWRKIKGVKY